ncbi:MAG: high-potential iron-sulfur protein [Myxococcales bacterium]|nr:MAG: high-potential iron-sulfur protein [Myxococcales bacterium]
MKKTWTRRRLLQFGGVAGGSMLLMPSVLSACGKKEGSAAAPEAPKALDCSSTTGLAPADLATRNALKYVDSSPDAQKNCANCALFVAPTQEGGCGSCQVVKGTINPKGYCNSWAPKPEATTGQPT